MSNNFLEIYPFYTFQGYELQCAIENMDVHLILTKYILVLTSAYFPTAHCCKHPQSPQRVAQISFPYFSITEIYNANKKKFTTQLKKNILVKNSE